MYSQVELIKTLVKNENHPGTSTKKFTKEEYVDKQGRVILSRTFTDYPIVETPEEDDPIESFGFQGNDPLSGNTQTVPHDTYYVYDDFGNLSFILTPKMNAGSNSLSNINSNLASLGYQYVYDHKNRLIEKKFPGKAIEYIVYNKLDQPVLTQDGNQRAKNQWLFTKYDVFGRTAYTGLANSSQSRTQLQNAADSYNGVQWVSKTSSENTIGGVAMHYDNTGFPNSIITETLTVSYFDDYNFDLDGSTATVSSYGVPSSTNTKSLSTATKVKVIDANEPNKWITTITYYDEKGREIYTYENNNYLQTTLMVEYLLDFTGKILKSSTRHIKNGETITTLNEFTYDHTGRILSNTQCIGGGLFCYECTQQSSNSPSTTDIDKELIFYSTYDELGQQVTQKKVGGIANGDVVSAAGLQTIDYSYNIRNWLTSINDTNINTDVLNLSSNDLFGFKLRYDQPTSGIALFDGNISEISWKTNNTDNSLRNYQYTYDPIGRIKSAIDNTGNYNLTNVEYDKNGNITKLKRNGWQNSASYANMDDLVYNYTGNTLSSLNDSGDDDYGFVDKSDGQNEYTYDVNGNLKTDANKGITNVDYSLNNLPTKVEFDSNENIQYVYDAMGIKQRKTVSNGDVTDYAGSYIYVNDELKFFNQPEGYVEPDNDNYKYVYQYKDNLGNVRLSYADADKDGTINSSTEIVEENNYYPFGMKHKGYNEVVNGRDHSYEYNGKEIDNELGLDWYHYGFRMYDPAMARFTGVDPISDQFAFVSTYNYAENSPIANIDLHGLQKKPSTTAETLVYNKESDYHRNSTKINASVVNLNINQKNNNGEVNLDFKTHSATLSLEQSESSIRAEASAALIDAEIGFGGGTDNAKFGLLFEGNVVSFQAKAEQGIYNGSNGKIGIGEFAKVGAVALEGEATFTGKLGPVSLMANVDGALGGVKAGAGGWLYYDVQNEEIVLKATGEAAFILGAGVDASISFSLGNKGSSVYKFLVDNGVLELHLNQTNKLNEVSDKINQETENVGGRNQAVSY